MRLFYTKGRVFVHDPDDWITLRKTHRIVGTLVGNTEITPMLPAKLLPEEALLIQEKQIASIVILNDTQSDESDNKEVYEKFLDEMFQQQTPLYQEKRRLELENVYEKNIAKKGTISKEDFIQAQLKKSSNCSKETVIWPIFQSPLNLNDREFTEVSSEILLKQSTPFRYAVFKDLWEKGYYLTAGQKFGGDFLVYKGDPLVFHAIFILICLEDANSRWKPRELVAFGRLANAVRKKTIFAIPTTTSSDIKYVTLSWAG